MPGQDLFFKIFARDVTAERTFKSVGRAADHLSNQIGGISLAAAGLGSLSSVGATAFGGLLAAPAAAGAGAAAMGTLAVAVRGVGDAFASVGGGDAEAFSESMRNLAPDAQAFVREGVKVNATLTGLRKATQGEFFAPLLGGMSELSGSYLPMLNRQVPTLARGLGTTTRELVATVAAGRNVERVGRIIESTGRSTDYLGQALGAGVDLFIHLGDVGGGFIERLSRGLATGTTKLAAFLETADNDGRLDRLIDTAADSLEHLGAVLAPLGESLFNAFSAPGTQEAAQTLFATLGAGTQILSTLIGLVGQLPGGLQSTLIVMGALGVVASKGFQAFQSLTLWSGNLSNSLGKLGTTGARAGRVVEVAAAGVGRLGASLLAAQVAGASLGENVNPQIESLSRSMTEWAKTGKTAGEAARLFGDDLELLRYDLASLSNWDTGAAKVIEGLTGLGSVFDKSVAHATERLNAYDQALASMVQSGATADAEASFAKLAKVAGEEGTSVEELKKKLPGYAAALEGASSAQLKAIKAKQQDKLAQDSLNTSWEEAIRLLGDVTAAHDLYNGKALDYDRAVSAAEAAVDDLTKSIGDHGKTLSQDTEDGRANREELLRGIDASVAAAQAIYDKTVATAGEGAATADAAATYNKYIKAVRDAAIAAGLNKTEVDNLIGALGRMPTMVATPVTVPGATASATAVVDLQAKIKALTDRQIRITDDSPDARRRIEDLQRQIDDLHGKEIQIKTTIWEQRNYSGVGDFSGSHGYRFGGINVPAARMGRMQANVFSGGQPLYRFAEPGTGEEALIPKNGDVGRSRGYARRVVDDWLGGPETIWPGMGGGGGGAGVAQAVSQLAAAVAAMAGKSNHLTISAAGTSPLEQLLLRVLRDAIQARGGNVQSALGT